ncbi:hypothetical protein QTP86_025665 [Hemibagrus guttatus]|nr:hypothetical protein QTP86_025665 [Hemibagrus guttatus]
MLLNQLREITGIQDLQVLQRVFNESQGDISHAVGLLTTQTAEKEQVPEEAATAEHHREVSNQHSNSASDELQVAIELSLQESQQAEAEERELHRALEASAEENAVHMTRKRNEASGEMCSPADWIRQEGWPVGIRNVGNTCWFSAVIQSLFHLPVFRRLVLNYCLSERVLEKCKSHSEKRNIAFMQELQCLFALMVGSNRRFVDPSAAVELLKDAFRTSEAQQDVSEFTHKLLDWLEDAFQLAANGSNPEDKQDNPMVQLFYGTFVAQRVHEGKILSTIEQFGQYPLQVNGFSNLDECLEGAMVAEEIESLHCDQTVSSGQERWFSKLPPVLTFELSRFEFNQSLGRPEKIHKKLEFPQIIYMDRYLHRNVEQTHGRRGEVKRLKDQLTVLQQKLESHKNYGSGPNKYPLTDMLQYILEFATSKQTNTSTSPASVGPASSPAHMEPSSVHTRQFTNECTVTLISQTETDDAGSSDGSGCTQSSTQKTPIHKPFTQCRPPADWPQHPVPGSVSEEELHFVRGCLQRWRAEAENNMNELKASIDKVSQALEGMYSDNSLCQVPYRLHAVLVHEGQASAGHYWAYIYDYTHKRWLKYNDVMVTESSWEELVRDSYGGMTNASAYCLMYINDRLSHLIAEDTDNETGQVLQGMDSLPPVLKRYVHEDNRWFQQQLQEWEKQLHQASQEEPQVPVAQASTSKKEKTLEPEHPNSEPEQENSHRGKPNEPTPEAEQEPIQDSEEASTSVVGSDSSPESSEGVTEGTEDASSLSLTHCQLDESQSPVSTAQKDEETVEAESEIINQTVGEQTETEAALEPQPETDKAESQATSAEDSQAEARQPENEVSEVEIPNVGKILVLSDADGYNEEMMLTPAMQGVILAIAKARQVFDKDGPEAGLIKAFHEEYSRLYEISQEEITPQQDPRLQHVLVYLFQNKAPDRIIERTLLEQFGDRNLSFDDRSISIMREARAKLRLIKPEDMDMEEYMQWQDDYSMFKTVFAYLLTGLEQYQNGKIREALIYLAHAYQDNAALLKSGEKRGVDHSLIALYRRKCLKVLTLNFILDRSRPGLTTTTIGAVDLQGVGGNWATVGGRSRGGRRVHRQREKRKGKGRELADMMERRKVDILCVQETRWKGSKARSIGAGFKLFYYGVDSKRNGVGVVLKEEFVRNVLEVGCELEEKERFWSELDEVMESIPTGERVVIGADFNGHVGEGNTGDEEVMGKFGVKERNLEGQMVVDFAKRMDMAVVNTYFQKREEHKSGGRSTQVVLPDDWETTAEVIRETGRKVLGVSSGRRKEDKETWWGNEEVQDSVQRKRLAKKKWDMDRTEENRQEYKELQRRVKREVSKAKQKAYDELYTRLDTREGEKDLYRLARQSDRDGKDVQQYRDGQRELHCVFVDLEKAYDRVPREELWYCMRKSGVAEKYVRVVQDMYERSRTVVRCAVGQTEEFKVEVGLHQGSTLSPFLFAIVMDQLSEEVRQESSWTMMFADDIVICSESREQVEENLERWRFALERRGMKVSRSKTEYMCVNEREGSGTVRLQSEEVKKVQEFKYLGSTVQSNGECGKEELNENAATLFKSGEDSDVEEGVTIMNDCVIPCMHLMVRDSITQEDMDAIDAIRSHWCSYLGQDMDEMQQEKLSEFLPRVLDCSAERVVLKEPPKVRKSSHDLCSRLAAIMESIHSTSVVTVK